MPLQLEVCSGRFLQTNLRSCQITIDHLGLVWPFVNLRPFEGEGSFGSWFADCWEAFIAKWLELAWTRRLGPWKMEDTNSEQVKKSWVFSCFLTMSHPWSFSTRLCAIWNASVFKLKSLFGSLFLSFLEGLNSSSTNGCYQYSPIESEEHHSRPQGKGRCIDTSWRIIHGVVY